MSRKSTKRSKKRNEQQDIHQRSNIADPGRSREGTNGPHGNEDISTSRGQVLEQQRSGLTSLNDYYEDPEPEPEDGPVFTQAQLESIREAAYREHFGVPVRDFREGIMARLNSRMRS